jgi:hypothetical protein
VSDKLRFLQRVKDAGPRGVHSHDIRREGISGHPSERARELEAEGHPIRRERQFVNGRNGVRFFYVQSDVGLGAGTSSGAPSCVDSGVEGSPANDNATTPLSASSESAGEPHALSLFEAGESAYERMRDREAA